MSSSDRFLSCRGCGVLYGMDKFRDFVTHERSCTFLNVEDSRSRIPATRQSNIRERTTRSSYHEKGGAPTGPPRLARTQTREAFHSGPPGRQTRFETETTEGGGRHEDDPPQRKVVETRTEPSGKSIRTVATTKFEPVRSLEAPSRKTVTTTTREAPSVHAGAPLTRKQTRIVSTETGPAESGLLDRRESSLERQPLSRVKQRSASKGILKSAGGRPSEISVKRTTTDDQGNITKVVKETTVNEGGRVKKVVEKNKMTKDGREIKTVTESSTNDQGVKTESVQKTGTDKAGNETMIQKETEKDLDGNEKIWEKITTVDRDGLEDSIELETTVEVDKDGGEKVTEKEKTTGVDGEESTVEREFTVEEDDEGNEIVKTKESSTGGEGKTKIVEKETKLESTSRISTRNKSDD